MRGRGRWVALATAVVAALVVAAPATAQDEPSAPSTPPPLDFGGAFTSPWTKPMAQKIRRTEGNTLPVLEDIPPLVDPSLYIWDAWPLRTESGSVAVIDGWTVLIALTAPRQGNIPGERHALARWRYFYTRGERWRRGGLVFPAGTALGDRQWAGSAVYNRRTERATFFYTALGDQLPPEPTYDAPPDDEGEGGLTRQQMAQTSARVVAGPDGVRFRRFTPHRIVLTADGEYYLTGRQAQELEVPYVFRDPWYFRDPASGRRYLLFSAMSALQPGPHAGVVGIAELVRGRWIARPPVISAAEVNFQLERPHVVVEDGRYYLFVTSHDFTFAPGIDAPDGLYGFVSDSPSVRGHYTPLNRGGLVLGNPAAAPLQLYSFLVMPGGWVLSYINYYDLGDVTLEEIGLQSRQWQREHFGGTLAPLFELQLAGDRTFLLSAGRGTPVSEAPLPPVGSG